MFCALSIVLSYFVSPFLDFLKFCSRLPLATSIPEAIVFSRDALLCPGKRGTIGVSPLVLKKNCTPYVFALWQDRDLTKSLPGVCFVFNNARIPRRMGHEVREKIWQSVVLVNVLDVRGCKNGCGGVNKPLLPSHDLPFPFLSLKANSLLLAFDSARRFADTHCEVYLLYLC